MSDLSRRPRGAGTAALGALGAILIAGLMIAIGVAPAVAASGVGTSGGGIFSSLPAALTIGQLQQKTEIYAISKGKPKQIAAFYNQNREVVTWDQIPKTVTDAVIAGEDQRFYEHGAVDPMGILRAVVADVTHSDSQGASTITQQYVKNVCVQQAELLSTDAAVEDAYYACTQPDLARKVKEAREAIELEKTYSKKDILLGYLNIAGFGGQIYGIETAAQYYYGIHAKDLTAAQAASLVAIVNEPSAYRLDEPENIPADTTRRNYILAAEHKLGMLSATDAATAEASKVVPRITPTKTGCAQAGAAAYFCEYVTKIVETNPVFGKDAATRAQNLQSAGWKIYTTLDLGLEKAAQATMNEYVPKKSPEGDIGGAAVTVQVGTGHILSMVQSKTFDETDAKDTRGAGYTATSINYNVDKIDGGSTYGFQPGSTYKLFTTLDWLKQNHGLYEQVDGTQRSIPFSQFKACGEQLGSGTFTFGNDEGSAENGYNTVYNGLARSINGTFASMATKLDLCDIRDMALALGVHTGDGSPLQYNPSAILGTNTVAPLTMATAYAGVANQGKACDPIAIDHMTTATGTPVPVPKQHCTQGVDPQVAIAAGYALHGVFGGTADGDESALDGSYGMVKTGTSDGNKDTWEVGGTTKTTTAVWVGSITGQTDLRAVYSFPGCGGQAAAARHCIWRAITASDVAKYPGATTWPTPEQQYLYGQQSAVPNLVGQSVDDAKQALTAAGFRVKVKKKPVVSDQQAGLIAASDPVAGSDESAGTQVTLSVSAGPVIVPTPTPTDSAAPGATATVPNVVGQTLDAARGALSAVGIASTTVTYTPGPGGVCVVYGQNPPAGSVVPVAQPVALTVYGSQDQCP